MSKLHIVCKISLDLYQKDTNWVLERVQYPLPELHHQIPKLYPNSLRAGIDLIKMGSMVWLELDMYAFHWIRYMFPDYQYITSGYSPVDQRYHVWVQKPDGTVRSQGLADALHKAHPSRVDQLLGPDEDRTILSEEESSSIGLGKVDMVLEVEQVLLVTEHVINIDQLPKPGK